MVRPSDSASLSRIFRWSTCLWGGRVNPIIPVGRYPKCWRATHGPTRKSDREIARDYMSFFEPDILVEAEDGLAESIGYGSLAEGKYGSRMETQLLSLDELFSSPDAHRPKLQVGLSIMDVYRDLYESERKFALRDAPEALIFNENKYSKLVEVVFGAFPKDEGARQFFRAYVDVFNPKSADVSPEHWFELFEKGAISPFVPTNHQLEITPRSGTKLSFFIFDHRNNADLIDYWNKRLFEQPVYPIPLCWMERLGPTIANAIRRNNRPIPNNPQGLKFHSTVYLGRSISDKTISGLYENYFSDLPERSLIRGGIWHPRIETNSMMQQNDRHAVSVESKSIDATLDEERALTFETLHPAFASRFGSGKNRWVNVVNLRSYSCDHLALSFPTNLENRSNPRLFTNLRERPIVSREGWVLGQKHKNHRKWLRLVDGQTAISEWLEQHAIKAIPSNAGRIARQLIDSLGNLWATHLIADKDTLELLDKMARSESRTTPYHRWEQLIRKRGEDSLSDLSIEEFTKRGALKLGLEVECTSCDHANWYGLDQVDYEVRCERCQQMFRYPQGTNRVPWRYRIAGPFSVPRFAEGAYNVALTLNMFRDKLNSSMDTEFTYATGTELKHDKFEREIDFSFWIGDGATFGQRSEPRFVIGEAKSFASEAITKRDIDSLKMVASAVPGTTIVVSVLKEDYSEHETELLRDLVRWGWKFKNGTHRAQTIILTGREVFSDFSVGSVWKDAGPPYEKFDEFHTFQNLDSFAYATQKIYTGLDFFEERRKLWKAT